MSDAEIHRLALAVEQLNTNVQTGLTAVRGDINLLARGENQNAKDIGELKTDVNALKARSFPLPTIGGLCGVAAVILAGIQALGKG